MSLNASDLHFLSDPAPLLAKQRIVAEVKTLLEKAGQQLLEMPHLIAFSAGKPAKVSKGENLQGLPFLVLDVPKIGSEKAGFRNIRVLVWWGRMVSISLLLKGEEQTEWLELAAENLALSKLNLEVCSLWQNEKSGLVAKRELVQSIFQKESEIRLTFSHPIGELAHLNSNLLRFCTLLKRD